MPVIQPLPLSRKGWNASTATFRPNPDFPRYYDKKLERNGNVRLVQRCRKLADNAGLYRSKKTVRTLADEFLAPLNNGQFTTESTMSVVDFWDKRYFPDVEAQKSPSTVSGYKNMWARYLKSHMKMPIREFRTVDCQQILEAVVAKYDVSNTTARHVKHLLGGLFRYALQIGVLNGVNPVTAARIPKSKPGRKTYAYSLVQILKMLEILPQPAKAIVAVAGFAGLRKGELRCLRPSDYDGSSLRIERAAWRHHIAKPKGKRGTGVILLVPTAAKILDEHLATTKVKNFIFETFRGDPGDIESTVDKVIRPALAMANMPWYDLHAFRRGLATNLHSLGIRDIVIQAILRHSNVSVTRASYIKNDGVDPRSLAAMEVLESAACNQNATGASEAESGADVKH
jgi:integrase